MLCYVEVFFVFVLFGDVWDVFMNLYVVIVFILKLLYLVRRDKDGSIIVISFVVIVVNGFLTCFFFNCNWYLVKVFLIMFFKIGFLILIVNIYWVLIVCLGYILKYLIFRIGKRSFVNEEIEV